jgi:arylformamidase
MAIFSAEYLNQQYNNRLRVPDFAKYLQRWQQDSAQVRISKPCHLAVAYGSHSSEQLDIFPANQADAPVMVFIHGGYWRSLDKSDHSFVAPAFTQTGACVVVPNYPLCPTVTMEQLVLTQVHALVWVYRHITEYGGDPKRITVIGHSAGGHLAAMLLACEWQRVSSTLPQHLVRNALSLSGLHDLAPIMQAPYLQNDLHLTSSQVRRCSPAYFPTPLGELIALCGADESDEFLRQNKLIEDAWGSKHVKTREALLGLNHFSVLEALCTPGHRAHDLALNLLRK